MNFTDPTGMIPEGGGCEGDDKAQTDTEKVMKMFPGYQNDEFSNYYGPFGSNNFKSANDEGEQNKQKADDFMIDISRVFKTLAKYGAEFRYNNNSTVDNTIYTQTTVDLNTSYARPFDDTKGDKFSERGFKGKYTLEDIPIFLIYKTGDKINHFTFHMGSTTYSWFEKSGEGAGYPINFYYNSKLVGALYFNTAKDRSKIIQKYYKDRVDFYFLGLKNNTIYKNFNTGIDD